MTPNWADQSNVLKSRATSERDLDRLEGWADMKYEIQQGQMKVVHLGRKNPMQQYRLETNWLGSWGHWQQQHEPAVCPGSKEGQHPGLYH